MAEKNQIRLVFAFLTLLVVLSYARTLQVPFVFDDIPNILENPRIRMTRITGDQIKPLIKSPHPFCSERIVSNFSFALNYLLHQYDTTGYHLVNLCLHLISAILVFLIARQTLVFCRFNSILIPVFAAALWAVNPVHVESVTYIIQRMNELATMFYLLVFFCYISARNKQRQIPAKNRSALVLWLLAFVFFAAAILSKQTAATLPFYIFLYEWFFFQDLSSEWLRKQTGKIWLIILLSGLAIFLFLGSSPIQSIKMSYTEPLLTFTMKERLLTESRVVIYYVSLLFYPHPARLNFDYDIDISRSFLSPDTTWLAMAALLALIATSIISAKKHRLVAFAIIWFLGNLVIESSFICMDLMVEHRVYSPSIFPCIALAWWLKAYLRSILPVILLLAAATGIFFVWTYQRNLVWKDTISLWRDTVLKSPEKARPHTNLCGYLSSTENTEEAIFHCHKALSLSPDNIQAHNSLGSIYTALKQYDKAADHYQRSLAIKPDSPLCYDLLGVLYAEQGETHKAISAFKKAIALNPNIETPYINLGQIYIDLQEFNKAGRHLKQALNLNPHSVAAYNNLGIVFFQTGKTDAALRLFLLCLRIDPDYRPALENIARIQSGTKYKP